MKVLIIEDNESMAKIVEEFLKIKGIDSKIVDNLYDATPLLKNYYHAIICDHNFYSHPDSSDTLALGTSIYFELRMVLSKRTPFFHWSGYPAPSEYVGMNPDPNFFSYGKDRFDDMIDHIMTIFGKSEEARSEKNS